MPNGTATITIPVTTFNRISSGLKCVIGTLTTTGDTRVQISPAGGVVVKPILNDGTALNLVFQLSGLGPSYNIAAVVFGVSGNTAVFTGQTGNNTGSVTVADALATTGAWEFYVIVQQGSGGNIGLIDPPIENDQAT